MNVRLPVVLLTSLLPYACAQETAAPKAQGQAPASAAVALLEEMLEQFRKEGITYDKATQTVAVAAVVNEPQDPIEYLLIHRRGKRHEAIFCTEAKPSVLNAALLLLGLEPGKNATYVEKDPMPTLEEIENGVDPLIVTPPTGRTFWMTVRWQQGEKTVEHCVEDLVLDLTTQEPLVDCKWVYLGGRMAQIYKGDPEVYMADAEGNLVSVCYMSPDNHLGTIVHERARDDQNWWLTNKVPEPGTEVKFVFHKVEPVVHQEREKRLRAAKQAKEGEAKPVDGRKDEKKDGR